MSDCSSPPWTGEVRAGAAAVAVDFRGAGPVALIGWGPGFTRRASSVDPSRISLRALVIDDGHFGRVCLLTGDLWAGSHGLTQRIAESLAQGCHLDEARILFTGTHTHSGPAGVADSDYYQTFAGSFVFDSHIGAFLADRIVTAARDAIEMACERLCTGKRVELQVKQLGFPTTLEPWHINRSAIAYSKNPESLISPTQGIPESLERRLTDSLAHLLVVREVDSRQLVAVWGTVGCHAAALGKNSRSLDGDYIGRAAAALEEGLRVPVALGAGAVGDVDPQPPGLRRAAYLEEREDLARATAHLATLAGFLTEAIASAVGVDEGGVRSFQLESHLLVEQVAGLLVGGGQMPDVPAVGLPVLGGSELGRGAGDLEGKRLPTPNGPHGVKRLDGDGNLPLRLALAVANDVMRSQPTWMPLRLVKFGQALWVAGLPGEPTTMLARRLRKHLVQLGAERAVIAGVTGSYHGYFSTPEEYGQQAYEGASTIWGPLSEAFLHAAFASAARPQVFSASRRVPPSRYSIPVISPPNRAEALLARFGLRPATLTVPPALKPQLRNFRVFSFAEPGVSALPLDVNQDGEVLFLVPLDLPRTRDFTVKTPTGQFKTKAR
jgi:neutral ceramidase